MKKLAIIGASYFQNPLILKAKELGIETHVFAWEAGDIGERTADCFYPISIVDKEAILEKCQEIEIDGITTIGSDLATIPVGYVAEHMGLIANSKECIAKSTDKSLMRRAFKMGGDPSPRSITVHRPEDVLDLDFEFPLIVKPSDRSGSRGVTKLDSPNGLYEAVAKAIDLSFSKAALVEEYARGSEYSVEHISWKGEHRFLAITEKFTTGAPHFIETGHLEPARIEPVVAEQVRSVVAHALTSLGIEYGASHAEVKVDANGSIKLIEIGARMGGDFIGSDLVQLSTGYDFLKAVIDVALGSEPDRPEVNMVWERYAGVRFAFNRKDIEVLGRLIAANPDLVVRSEFSQSFDGEVVDSSNRRGYCLFASNSMQDVLCILPV